MAPHRPLLQYLAAAVAAGCLLAAAPAAAAPGIAIAITVVPMQCKAVPIDFGWNNFNYNAGFTTPPNSIPPGCAPEDFQITKLYMGGTCSTQRNNDGSGCSGGGIVVPNSNSFIDPSICPVVFSDAPSSALVTLKVPSNEYRFDYGSMCTKTDYGWFFVRNTCNQTGGELTLDLKISATTYSGGCYHNGFPSWARVAIAIVCGIIAIALFAFALKRCRQRPASGPVAVQMAPTTQAGYYSGSAAYGAQPTYGQAPAYAGAWGAAGQPPSRPAYGAPPGYPSAAGGGYGPPPPEQPQHYPAPMTTVTLGAPTDGFGSQTSGSAAGAGASGPAGYPPPSTGAAAFYSAPSAGAASGYPPPSTGSAASAAPGYPPATTNTAPSSGYPLPTSGTATGVSGNPFTKL